MQLVRACGSLRQTGLSQDTRLRLSMNDKAAGLSAHLAMGLTVSDNVAPIFLK